MNVSLLQRTPALAVAGLLIVTGCATPPSSPPPATGAAAAAAKVPTPMSEAVLPNQPPEAEKYQWSNFMTPDTPTWRLLEKVVEATGGAAVVDGVKTLVSTGKIQMRSAVGAYESTVTTTFLFPTKVRREVVLPSGAVISTTFTPGRAWMAGALGNIELPAGEREQLEESAMRTPLALLKSRRHKLFRVAMGDSSGAAGEPRDVLVIRFAGETTEAVLDGDHRIVELSWEAKAASPEGKNKRIHLRYSDFRTADGLVFPFSSDAFSGEEMVSSLRVDSLRLNAPVPPELFEPPFPSPAPTPTPPPR